MHLLFTSRDNLFCQVPSLLNANNWIWPRFCTAVGHTDRDAHEHQTFKPAELQKLRAAMDLILPTTYAALCQANTTNVFKTVPVNMTAPWLVCAIPNEVQYRL